MVADDLRLELSNLFAELYRLQCEADVARSRFLAHQNKLQRFLIEKIGGPKLTILTITAVKPGLVSQETHTNAF